MATETKEEKKAPYAKYIRPYTQKMIEERVIPFMQEREKQPVKFAAAVHKMVVYYLDRKNIS